MEFCQVLWILFLCMYVVYDLSMADTSVAQMVSNADEGIWALSSRFVGIFLASFNGAEITSSAWSASLGYSSDVAYDLATESLVYCKSVGSNPFDCELHRTSLDQCYDVAVTTIPMDQESYGLEVNSDSRLAYLSLFETPGIIEVNLETGRQRMLFDNEDVYYVRISPDKNFLYFTCLSNDPPIENHIRKGNIDGTGVPETLLTRTKQIFGFGIDFPSNQMYYTQDFTIFSSDLNGNNERELVTDTGRIYEMSVVDNYLYWGGNFIFKRLSLSGDPSTNSIETLLTSGGNQLINHLFISPSQLEMSKSTLTLDSSEYTANEVDQSLTINVIRTGNLFRCSCVDLLVFTGNRRFTRQAIITNTLNFASGDTTKSHTLTWVDNAEAEGPDEVTVLLRNFDGANAGSLDAATVVIRDDDCRYSFETTAVTVNEDVGYFDVTVRRACTGTTPYVAATIRIEAEESNGGARQVFDFTSGTDVNFPSGEDTVTSRLYIINDNEPEDLETFNLRIPLPENGLLGEPNSITVSIEDFDTLYIINQAQLDVLESNGPINIVIQRLGNRTVPGSVALSASIKDGAGDKSDFILNPRPAIIEFAKDVGEVLVPILIVNDALVESNETFEVRLQSPVNGNLDDRRSAVIKIIDDEVEVMLASSHVSCMESHPCSVTVMRSGYLSGTTTSRIKTEDLSAVAEIDYMPVDTMVTFNPWVTTQEVQISLIDDDTKEPQSSFILAITEVTGGRVGDPSRGYVALWDDDDALPVLKYSLEQSSYTVLESEGPLEIIVLRAGSYLGQSGSVRIVTQSSTTNTDDFENVNLVVNFEENQSKQSIFISITNDEVIEVMESLVIQLSDVENGMLVEPMHATVSIVDDDATYSFDRPNYPVHENAEERVISVQRNGYIQNTGYVTLQIKGGSATFEEDYNFSPIGHILKFEPGQTKIATVIRIVDDQIEEETETIDISLSRPQNGTLGNPSSSKVLIEDDDRNTLATTESTPSQSSQIDTVILISIVVASIVAGVIITTLCILGILVFCRRRASPRLYPSPPPIRQQGHFPYGYDKSNRNEYIGYY